LADLERDHSSRLRNSLIAGAFYRRGLIEQWGRGTQKIVNWCVAGGQPEPEFEEEQAGAVVVRFRPNGYHPPLRVSHDLTDRQRRLLLILSNSKELTFPNIYSVLEDPPSERTVRKELRSLSELGLVSSRGRGKFARWWLAMPDK
jgi:ATP-dependent DNA helicase RecG